MPLAKLSHVLANNLDVGIGSVLGGLSAFTVASGAEPYEGAPQWIGWLGSILVALTPMAILAAAATGCWSHLAIYDDMEEPVATNDLAVAYDSGDGLHPNQTGQNAIEALVSPEVGP